MKTKPIILVVLTLIIGFVLGMLTSAQLRLNRLKPVRFYFSDERFREGFYKIIQPDEKQKAEIDKILDKYNKKNRELQEYFWKESESNMRAFRKEIDSKLTREQISRLREMDERREKMIRDARRRHRHDSLGHQDSGAGDRRFRQFDDAGRIPEGNRPPPRERGPAAPSEDPRPSFQNKQEVVKQDRQIIRTDPQ
ncbi:MAG TPA: Spy/CpxP family protein refolding chaperone [Bacteroidales bacterium]|jgi:hypothetical protein|nr:Spy/CpxP family protein refolding chaperone [Bacteroidales bacterium]HOS71468.1 Spy/CpxP family protein refolding chaperone [Bacteroidales bacterium]HQH23934.1 Spy/CpxP family protein refolding chaperone [Bacteroidales bacterium]HQJ81264.1 Spy/CpxP family protein refolding chaperone [Bacteroidales bacterium]